MTKDVGIQIDGDWKQYSISQRIGFSSSGWRLVWDALKAAIRRNDIPHTDRDMKVTFWAKSEQVQVTNVQVQERSELSAIFDIGQLTN